ncbi:MAG TPA: hypothetical protein VF384_15615 [Planctomycetota bacterium]
MDALTACLHIAAYGALAIALPVPRARKVALLALLIAALVSIVQGALGEGERTLITVHTYPGYEGSAVEVSVVSFPTGTVSAPAWMWPLPWVGFAGLWILVLRLLGRRPAGQGHALHALVLPLLFAWSATAAWLGMQCLAAPAPVVQPFGLDRFLFPSGLAVAILAARACKTLRAMFVTIGASTIAARLPAALFSKIASDLQLGTSLDISSVRDIVNPMNQMQFEPRIEPGSGQQQFWLIWLEHVIMFPALYLMSLVGIGFAVFMFHKHGPEHAPGAPAAPARGT